MPLQDPEHVARYLQRRVDQLRRARRIVGDSTVTGSMLETQIHGYSHAIDFLARLQADHCLNAVLNLQTEAVKAAAQLAGDDRVQEDQIGWYLAMSEIMLATDGIETLAGMKAWSAQHDYDFDAGAFDG